MEIESAWPKYPDYRIDLIPINQTVRVWFGDLLLAESSSALRLEETRHIDRLYVPEADIRWEHFRVAEGMNTVCPFKGMASYWDLISVEPAEVGLVWAYPEPFDEVAGIKGHIGFYHERTRVEIEERWSSEEDPAAIRIRRFPVWGDAGDLVRLMDVEQAEPGLYIAPAYRYLTRNVVEGGQLLGQAIAAASKTVQGQRVISGYMIFSKAAAFDAPLSVQTEVLRGGRTFSTVEARVVQHEELRSVGLMLLDAGSPDVIQSAIPMPEVPGPHESVDLDMGVTGRDLRIVEGAYDPDPDRIGPPVIYAWCRFRDDPGADYLHAALLAQSTTHWTIAAALRPHQGFGEAMAHETLATGIMSTSIAFHDDVDVTQWLLYANPAVYAGRGLAQGEGHVFTREGRLVATYTVQSMIRQFTKSPEQMGLDSTNAM